MTEKLRQSLSAVMDDEADAFELRRVLDELGRDEELRDLWGRYHLIGSVLRGERRPVPPALRDRVWTALQGESAGERVPEPVPAASPSAGAVAPGVPPARQPSRAGRITGLAVAASVAFAVVLGMSGLWNDDAGPIDTPLAVRDSAPVAADNPAAEVGSVATAPDGSGNFFNADVSPSDVQRAQAYILHHTQQQAINQAGVLPFVKLATYEAP